MTITLSALQKQRWDTAANWTAENPTLLAGEIGIESDTDYWKVGDGSTAWTSLAYVSGLGAEIAVSRLADGAAGQIIQTDAAGTGVEWSSTANLPLGSASAPAYRFQGDPNTGLYSPGADQVAISTNGTQRLLIEADGDINIDSGGVFYDATNNRLGIGTTSPDESLEVVGNIKLSQTSTQLIFEDSDSANLTINRFQSYDGAFIADVDPSNNGSVASTFRINVDGSERARIDSSGRLGLGTSSPATLFHIKAGSNVTTDLPITIQNNADSLRFGIGAYGLSNTVGTSQGTDFYYNVGRDHLFQTDGTTRVVIKEGGAVGIGTTSPIALLNVASADTGTMPSADADEVLIEGTGNTGISLFCGLNSKNSIYFGENTVGVSRGAIIYDTNTDSLAFSTNGLTNERARIDSSGRLLVGTSTARVFDSSTAIATPSFQVETTGANAAVGVTRNSGNSSGPAIFLGKSRSAALNGVTAVIAEDSVGSLVFEGADGTKLIEAALIRAQIDGTPGTNDMPGRLVFSTTADGASSPTERLRITSAGVLQVADAGDIAVGTTTGTKIGTATTQKLGFYNATPVVQPAAVADATTSVDVITQLNDLLAKLRALGIIAT